MVLVAGVALALPAAADEYLQGMVNSVNVNCFSVMGPKNTVAMITLKPGTNMPAALRPGVQIRFYCYQNPVNGQLVLTGIEEISATKLGPVAEPGINVPFTNGEVYIPLP